MAANIYKTAMIAIYGFYGSYLGDIGAYNVSSGRKSRFWYRHGEIQDGRHECRTIRTVTTQNNAKIKKNAIFRLA